MLELQLHSSVTYFSSGLVQGKRNLGILNTVTLVNNITACRKYIK